MTLKYNFLGCCFLVLMTISCDDRTRGEIYKEEFLAPGFKGVVDTTELWKGGLLVIRLTDEDKIIEIINSHKILNEIQKGDLFIKEPGSNRCSIKRSDSIFHFDCIKLELFENETREELGDVEQWDRGKLNQWVID